MGYGLPRTMRALGTFNLFICIINDETQLLNGICPLTITSCDLSMLCNSATLRVTFTFHMAAQTLFLLNTRSLFLFHTLSADIPFSHLLQNWWPLTLSLSDQSVSVWFVVCKLVKQFTPIGEIPLLCLALSLVLLKTIVTQNYTTPFIVWSFSVF